MSDLLDKKIDDLTVGDTLKLQGIVLAGMVGVGAVYYGSCVAYIKVADRIAQRKLRKQNRESE